MKKQKRCYCYEVYLNFINTSKDSCVSIRALRDRGGRFLIYNEVYFFSRRHITLWRSFSKQSQPGTSLV